ncbi:hypothetical protein CTAYLR_005557 [Chrysophaeum taylorii]|uniref:Amine oxidase n=1 Tax=Chrysophaeum taylorii TaxID=2483200 RepID=A0AAD7U4A3_9STRA|nr:hypothetical protein CTAYLR_005557 [Chrysophaeum taylorii]
MALQPPAQFREPARIEATQNYREATALSERLAAFKEAAPPQQQQQQQRTVAIVGGGLSGLSCAKYVADAGHRVILYEARQTLGGKVSAWRDADGDVVETGLHVFFGAYPNMLRLLAELGIRDRLQWKAHRMSFAMRDGGGLTSFEFPEGVPAPFNMAIAILRNREMLTLLEKARMVPGLLPMLVGNAQEYVDQQDELSVGEFMRKYGVPERAKDEVFEAMGKALDFVPADELSMAIILTAMNRFINEADGSQTAFLDGNQPDRLCAPLREYVENRGGRVFCGKPLVEILVEDDDTRRVRGLRFEDEIVVADEYVLAMPVDVTKRLIPREWSTMPFFSQLDGLEGVPVINVQLWFDGAIDATLDGLVFSRSKCLSVYADMAKSCREFADDRSMLSLVFAPVVTPEKNWLAESDDAIVNATVKELETVLSGTLPSLRKAAVVRTPRSVYSAIPGRNKYRPSQRTPVPNLVLAGDYTYQRYLGSMEGAVLAGKLAAEVVAARAANATLPPIKEPAPGASRGGGEPRNPSFVLPSRPARTLEEEPRGAIAFGGGEASLR